MRSPRNPVRFTHEEFNTAELEQRSELYRQIAERIWNPADLLREGQS